MTMAGLLASICQRHGVSVQHARGRLRYRQYVDVRKEFCRAAVDLGTWSTPQIGRFLNRDHTSVLYLAGRLKGRGRK